MWHKSIKELVAWIGVTISDLVLCNILEGCLLSQGETMMMEYPGSNASNTYKMFAWTHDELGWNNFVEGNSSWEWLHLGFLDSPG